jgi:hypothetical protein
LLYCPGKVMRKAVSSIAVPVAFDFPNMLNAATPANTSPARSSRDEILIMGYGFGRVWRDLLLWTACWPLVPPSIQLEIS